MPETLNLSAMSPDTDARIADGAAAERAGRYAEAREHYEAALRSLLPADAHLAATLLRWAGNAYRGEGDAEAARDCYLASHSAAEARDDTAAMAAALNCLGIVHQEWGALDDAERCYGEARALAVRAGAARVIAMADQNMGTVANIRGDHAAALEHYRRSLERYAAAGDDEYVPQVLNNMAMLYTDMAEWEEAIRLFDRGAELADRMGEHRTRAMIEVNRSELFILSGELERAEHCCERALELATRIDHPLALGEAHKNLGVLHRRCERHELAEEHLLLAAEISERYSNPLLAGEVQRELAEVYRDQGRDREALQALNYARRVFSDLRAGRDVEEIDGRLGDIENVFLTVVMEWAESIESKDRYTAGHCQRVADYSCMLARALGFDEHTVTWLRMGAVLHDVGKTVVPAEILNKRGPLNEDEWAYMRRHPQAGVELLARIEFPWDVRPMVRSHHERWDGAGYPEGLSGRAIPLSARILCVADVFDALTTTRAYRRAFSPREALETMERDAGRIFDPELFQLFRRLILERIEAGELVPAR